MAGRRKVSNAAALVAVLIVAVAAAAGAVCGVDDISAAVDACRPYCKVGSTQASPGQLCCDKVKFARWDCLYKYRSLLPSDIDAARVMALAKQCPNANNN